jgi:hypothetical protein
MTDYSSDSFIATLRRLDDTLAEDSDLRKALDEVSSEVGTLQQQMRQRDKAHEKADWYQRQLLEEIQSHLQKLDDTGISRREVLALFRKYWESTQDMRMDPKQAAAETDAAVDRLTKSAASVLHQELGRAPTRAEIAHIKPALVKALGRDGGQAYSHSREREARMRLAKALSASEINVWRRYGRVPDSIDVENPSPSRAVEQEQAVSLRVQQYLASTGLSPLVFGRLAQR